MSLSRRTFVQSLGVGAAGAFSGTVLGARGRGAWAGIWSDDVEDAVVAASARPIPLHNNENPLGPGKGALDAVRAVLGEGGPAGRYLTNVEQLAEAIARTYGVSRDHVMTGNGSTQLLQTATHVFTSKVRPLVAGSPTYEECVAYAELVGTPVRTIPLDRSLRLDLDAMAAASKGAGMVFVNNPNNPTATVHSGQAVAELVARVLNSSPDTTILIDEAYHDYVTDPSYATQVPLAIDNPRVLVARTFSKAHGMAGLRVGYVIGRPETLKLMRAWQYGTSMNVLGVAAATASIQDQPRIDRERARNTEARQFTLSWFEKAGYKATDSQANFIFVDVRQPLPKFRDACRERGVLVGRPFPPLTTYARISIGTIEEMRQAAEVFGKVLGPAATAAAAA